MTLLWTAEATRPLGDDWLGLVAGDASNGANIDPGSYTGNRITRIATGTHFPDAPSGAMCYDFWVNGDEEPQWTQTFDPRAELINQSSSSARTRSDGVDPIERNNQTRWNAFQINVSSAVSAAGHVTVYQRKSLGGGNGPFNISWDTNNNYWYLSKSNTQTNGASGMTHVWTDTKALKRNVPISFCLGVFWAIDGTGWYELWGDLADNLGYRQLKARTSGWTMEYGASSQGGGIAGATLDLYRSITPGNVGHVYFRSMSMATTRTEAEVAAHFGETTTTPPTGPVDVVGIDSNADNFASFATRTGSVVVS